MSTYLHDVANNVNLKASSYQTAGSTGNTAGSSGDFLQSDFQCFAVQHLGTVNGNSPSLTGKIQESTDGTTWTDITGATFTAAVTNSDLQTINFLRTARYLRHYATISGTGSLTVPYVGVIGEQLKQV